MAVGRYKPYLTYKPSDTDWVDDIPTEWEIKRTKSLLKLERSKVGQDSNSYQLLSLTLNGVIPRDISDGGGKIPAEFDAYQKVAISDLIFCLFDIDETPRTIGISHHNGMITGAYNVYSCLDGCAAPFIYFYFLHIDSFKGLRPFYTGLRKVVRADTFGNISIPCPPIDEQNKIAAFLDHETAKIDSLIAKQERMIELLKEKRQAVISHAVTKGLDPTAPLRPSGIDWLGDVPAHWEVKRLKYLISDLESGVSVNASDQSANQNETAVLKTSCVYTRSFRAYENKTVVPEEISRVKCPVRKGAIIISRMNTPELVGASAVVLNDSPNVFLPDRLWQTVYFDDKLQSSAFLAYFMMHRGFRSEISLAAEGASSSMQNIAKGDYLSIPVTLPSLNEQLQIVNWLVKKVGIIHDLERKAQSAIDLLKERRTALISAAVTGKIDLRDWQQPESAQPYSTQDINQPEEALT